MKKIAIFFFSGTGNTWWVTQKLAEVLGEEGHQAREYSIEGLEPGEADRLIRDADVVGFGYPVYGSDLPDPMKGFLTGLAPVNREAFIYCTQWLWSGDGARVATEFLHSGFRVKWAEHFLMPNNVSVSVLRLPYTNDKKKFARVLKRAEKRARKLAARISRESPFLRGFSQAAVLSGYLQRGPFRRMYEGLRDDISVDLERCTRCGQCVRLCPVGNLYRSRDSVKARGRCILCLRCYSFCPEMAVAYMDKVHRRERGVPYRGPVEGFNPEKLRPGGDSHGPILE